MGTTIIPLPNSGQDDEGYGPRFPASTGKGMGHETVLRESRARFKFPKPKKAPKKFIAEAEGKKNPGKKAKLKASKKPKNLRVGQKKKVGAFGEAYTSPSGNKPKGIRVAESMRRTFESRMGNFRRAIVGPRTVESILGSPSLLTETLRRFRASRYFAEAERFTEKAPEGWEGTVKKMKKHPEIDNPWALAHWMSGEGYQPGGKKGD